MRGRDKAGHFRAGNAEGNSRLAALATRQAESRFHQS